MIFLNLRSGTHILVMDCVLQIIETFESCISCKTEMNFIKLGFFFYCRFPTAPCSFGHFRKPGAEKLDSQTMSLPSLMVKLLPT